MSPSARPAVAVTGATGFIGRHLCERFCRLGWDVRALARDPSSRPFAEAGIRVFACDLPDVIEANALDGARAVVHCAYVTRHRDYEEARRVNDLGTRRVIETARAAGVARFVFLSSQSAHEGALSYYGRSKLALERLLSPATDLIFRPGLVLGPGDAGLFHRMCETVRRAKVIPLFGSGRQPLQTVHVDDLCAAILAAVEKEMAGLYTVAEPEPIPMGGFLRMLAERLDRHPVFLPFPMAPALLAFRAFETLRVPFPVSSENLLGLKQMRAVDTRPDLAALGVTVRTARSSLDAIFATGPGRAS